MAPVSNGTKKAPDQQSWTGAVLKSAIGAPSAELSLVGLRPRRARLRFTRQRHGNQKAIEKQDQDRWWLVVKEQPEHWVHVGPFWAPLISIRLNSIKPRGVGPFSTSKWVRFRRAFPAEQWVFTRHGSK